MLENLSYIVNTNFCAYNLQIISRILSKLRFEYPMCFPMCFPISFHTPELPEVQQRRNTRLPTNRWYTSLQNFNPSQNRSEGELETLHRKGSLCLKNANRAISFFDTSLTKKIKS